MITLRLAKDAPIGKKIVSKNANLIYPNNSTLATFVLWEKANPATQWSLIFKAMPQSVSNFPLFYTEEEKKLLTGSHFLRTIEELRNDMQHDYKQICEVAPEFAKVATLEDFMKTRTLVNSRIFGTIVNGVDDDAIVPYADMFNFKYGNDNTHWAYSDEAKGFFVKAKSIINKGEEIYVYYGNKPNYNFLQFYGFVIENNDNDIATLEVDIPESDPLKGFKEDTLEVSQFPKILHIMDTANHKRFAKAISYMRYVAFNGTKAELESIRIKCTEKPKSKKNDFRALNLEPISKENEEMALNLLKKVCEETLAKYPETYENDLELLKKPTLTFNEKNCILYRSSEKKVSFADG